MVKQTWFQYSLAIVAGILVGIYFQSGGIFLSDAAGFVDRVYQIPVIPFIVISIIFCFSKMNGTQLKRLIIALIISALALWVIADLLTTCVSLSFIKLDTPNFELPGVSFNSGGVALIDNLVPTNIFRSLSNGYIPGVVVFSLLLGFFLMRSKNKTDITSLLEVAKELLDKVVLLLNKLLPIALFIVLADAINHWNSKELLTVIPYFYGIAAYCLALVLLIFPLSLRCLTPIKFNELVKAIATPLLLALLLQSAFIALPATIIALQCLLKPYRSDKQSVETEQLIVPVLYNIPLFGSLSALLFIFFALAVYAVAMPVRHWFDLYLLGPISFFADPWPAVFYLLKTLGIPLDAFRYYPTANAIASPFAALLEVFSFAVVSTVLSFVTLEKYRPKLIRVVLLLVGLFISLLIVGLIAWSTSSWVKLSVTAHHSTTEKTTTLPGMALEQQVKTSFASPDASRYPASLETILKEKVLRVGVNTDQPPYCYLDNGHLMGFDISMVKSMAKAMGVKLQYVEFKEYDQIASGLEQGKFDIAVCGITVHAKRLRYMAFSSPLLTIANALIVKDTAADAFKNYASLRERAGLKVGALQGTIYNRLAKLLFPKATIVNIDGLDGILNQSHLDATLVDAPKARVWANHHPYYDAIIPKPGIGKQYYAWALPIRAVKLLHYVDTWLEINQALLNHDKARWIGRSVHAPKGERTYRTKSSML